MALLPFLSICITGELGKAPAAVEDSLPAIGATAGTSQVAEEDDEEDLESMKARLEALRS